MIMFKLRFRIKVRVRVRIRNGYNEKIFDRDLVLKMSRDYIRYVQATVHIFSKVSNVLPVTY